MTFKNPLSRQKEKLIREDVEKYLMGQIKMNDIVKMRKVSLYVVMKIEEAIIYEKLKKYRHD